MPRSEEDKRWRGRRYGRRAQVAAVRDTPPKLAALGARLLDQLARAGAAAPTLKQLGRALATRDTARLLGAVWQIVDALEQLDDARARTAAAINASRRPRRRG